MQTLYHTVLHATAQALYRNCIFNLSIVANIKMICSRVCCELLYILLALTLIFLYCLSQQPILVMHIMYTLLYTLYTFYNLCTIIVVLQQWAMLHKIEISIHDILAIAAVPYSRCKAQILHIFICNNTAQYAGNCASIVHIELFVHCVWLCALYKNAVGELILESISYGNA